MLGNPDYGIREIFACEIWNSVEFCLWNLESRIQLKQSRIPLTIGIHGVESGIQDYHGFPYTERKSYNIDEKRPKPQYPIIHCIVLCITMSYHSSRFILYMKGAFCALNRLLLFLKQKFSFMWLQRLTQRSNNAFTVLITASESQCGNFYPFKNRYW